MPTFEMDETGKLTEVKSVFDSMPAVNTDTVGLSDGYAEGDPDMVDVEYHEDGTETIHESLAGTTQAYREWIGND